MTGFQNHALAVTIAAVLAVGAFFTAGSLIILHNEPFPYRPLIFDDEAERFFDVKIPDVYGQKAPLVSITLNRRKLCPYFLEYRVTDASNTKLADKSVLLSAPKDLGEVSFKVTRPLNLLGQNQQISIGPAFDEFRIGSMCNPWQRWIAPNWGPGWIRTDFKWLPLAKK